MLMSKTHSRQDALNRWMSRFGKCMGPCFLGKTAWFGLIKVRICERKVSLAGGPGRPPRNYTLPLDSTVVVTSKSTSLLMTGEHNFLLYSTGETILRINWHTPFFVRIAKSYRHEDDVAVAGCWLLEKHYGSRDLGSGASKPISWLSLKNPSYLRERTKWRMVDEKEKACTSTF